jgi:hypothetical protein
LGACLRLHPPNLGDLNDPLLSIYMDRTTACRRLVGLDLAMIRDDLQPGDLAIRSSVKRLASNHHFTSFLMIAPDCS